MNDELYTIQNSLKGNVGVIILSGHITNVENTANSIRAELELLKNDPRCKSALLEMVNCYGGNVYEGEGILHYMDEFKKSKPLNTKGIGIIASMGFSIYLKGDEREMVKGSRLMSHEVKGGISGSAEQIESYADNVKKLNAEMVKNIASMIQKDEAYVTANLMRPGVDTYISADKAYKLGLSTKRPVSGSLKQDIPQNLAKTGTVNFH